MFIQQASQCCVVARHKIKALDGTGSLIRICLLDFSKAFDKIDHKVLISKLRNMNIHPVIVNWIIAFLSERYQRIKLKEYTSTVVGSVLMQVYFKGPNLAHYCS